MSVTNQQDVAVVSGGSSASWLHGNWLNKAMMSQCMTSGTLRMTAEPRPVNPVFSVPHIKKELSTFLCWRSLFRCGRSWKPLRINLCYRCAEGLPLVIQITQKYGRSSKTLSPLASSTRCLIMHRCLNDFHSTH